MNREDCYILGKVTKPQGIQGNVYCFLDTDQAQRYTNLESVLMEIHHELVPFFVESFALKGDNRALVKFAEVDSEEAARAIVNCDIYLPLSDLPQLEEGKFYYHEIIGYEVITTDNVLVGEVSFVIENTANHLLEIKKGEKEVLIPIRDEYLQLVNKKQKQITVSLPNGYLEAFTQ